VIVSELRFFRTAAGLSTAQSAELAREGTRLLREAVAQFENSVGHVGEGARAEWPDPCVRIRKALAEVMNACISTEQWTRYEYETRKRLAHERQLALAGLLRKLDRRLLMTPEQCATLATSLLSRWNEEWESLAIAWDDDELIPNIPDQLVVPHLDEAQQRVWSRLARYVGDRQESISASLITRLALWMVEIDGELGETLGKKANPQNSARHGPIGGNAPPEPQEPPTIEQLNQRVIDCGFDREDRVAGASAWLESLLMARLDYLDRICALTAQERKKLALAGRGDIKRFFDRVAELRRRLPLGQHGAETARRFRLDCQQVLDSYGEQLFDERSIFSKAIPKTLTVEQFALYQKSRHAAALLELRARIDLVIQSLDIVVGLNDEQRQGMTRLLCEATRSLPRSPAATAADDDFAPVLAQAARIPDANLRPICDGTQWRALSAFLKQVRDLGE
jgi:hypothetical protein